MSIELVFEPHWFWPDHEIAKYKGNSIVRGPLIHGHEIMDTVGEVRSGLTLTEAIELLKTQSETDNGHE